MPDDITYALTIGGFDPSNGAGITADVKTFAHFDVPCLAVQTCLTIQHESEVRKVYWHSPVQVEEQIDIIAAKYKVGWVKLSLVSSPESALQIAGLVKRHWPRARLVWDPILRASSGYAFSDQADAETLKKLLGAAYLALPNREEIAHWAEDAPENAAAEFSRFTRILLKGGHDAVHPGRDILYDAGCEEAVYEPERPARYTKHGSGCVFGSALVSLLAKGHSLQDAIAQAKSFILDFLDSDPGLLGRHPAHTSIALPHGI